MLDKVISIFKIPELRNKILFVIGIMAVFRLGAVIPASSIDPERLKNFFSGNQLFGILNLFTGGSLKQLSIMMLGLSPYITALIILQLLTMIFPKLKELYYGEGERGREIFNFYARLLTVPLAVLQGYGFLVLLSRQGVIEFTSFGLISSVIVVTGGAVFLMWLGELISRKGVGNGISLLIFAGIISGLPLAAFRAYQTFEASQLDDYLLLVLIGVIVIGGVTFITESQRNIPVSYAKRVRGHRVYGGVSTYLPIKVNQAGMIPLIFALSILIFPQTIFNFLSTVQIPWLASASLSITRFLQNQFFFGAFYFLLVVAFTYFYTQITFEPHTIAENLQKSGAFIPGVRPGQETASFLSRTVNRITLAGAIFLGMVAVIPLLAQALTGITTLTIGGTAILIVVAVVLETVRQVEAQLAMREY
ncbi:MAG: preprotein translocase subunit SecY [Candidatus Portnoybacteria bacterium]|nr:preprotein translocase subunit SecY [Candidatus Portnoybacteria bacterium]